MNVKRTMQTFAVVLALLHSGFAQVAGRYDNFAAKSGSGSLSAAVTVVPGAQIRVCTAAATGTPCNVQANIYSSFTLSVGSLISQPLSADSRGNYWFYADASQRYVIQITDPATGTVTELRDQALASDAASVAATQLIPAGSATQRFLAGLAANVADQFMAILCDSTCYDYPDGSGNPTVPRWSYLLVHDYIAPRNLTYTVKYRNVTDSVGTLGPWITIQTGTGSHTLWVSNFSYPGMPPQNHLGPNLAGIVAIHPSLIVFSHGHNMLFTPSTYKADYIAALAQISQAIPEASILAVSQNPEAPSCFYSDCTQMPAKADALAWAAEKDGDGFINGTQVFYDYGPTWATDLINPGPVDGVHANRAGQDLVAATVAAAFWYNRATAIRSGHPSLLRGDSSQLIANGNFNAWSGSCPDGWTVAGTTTCSQDVTAGHFRSPNGYGLKLQSTAGTGALTIPIALEEAKGRWVTATCSVYVPTGQETGVSGYAGWMAIVTDVGTNAQATVYTQDDARGAGALVIKVIQKFIDATTTTAKLQIYAGNGASTTNATFDWCSVTIGQTPSTTTKLAVTVASATTTSNVATTATTTNATYYPTYVSSSSSGNQGVRMNSGYSINPSTNTVTATTFAGDLTGNAATSTATSNVATTATTTNATYYPTYVSSSSSGNQGVRMNSGYSINPSTNTITATTFAGALTGNASTATALAANGTNCGAGQIPLGVDTSGNAEGCYTPTGSTVGLGSVTNDAQTKAAIVPNTAPSAGQDLVGNAGGTAYAPVGMSGDCTRSSTGAITCTKTNSVAFATSATTDTTNAANIGSGTLNAARLPNPTASTLGGVESLAVVSNQFMTGISTLGVPTQAQPAFSNISGTATAAQVPASAPAPVRGFCTGTATAATTVYPFELGTSTLTCTGTTETQQVGFVVPSSLNGATCGWLQVSAGTGGVNASSGLFTVRKNAVAQTTTCTVGTATNCNDPGTHTFSVATNDRLTVNFTTQSSETLANVGVSLTCKN